MTISSWYMDDDTTADQRLPHRKEGDSTVSLETLDGLGILRWSGITGENDSVLLQVLQERGYNYRDVCTISPDKLPNYDEKIKSFYREHIHYDEEIRLCLEGSGYFDIRDSEDRWIRIAVESGDMLILPEGIYHRFTCDEKDYIKAMRLFVGEPVWTPYNRDEIEESNPSRQNYVKKFLA